MRITLLLISFLILSCGLLTAQTDMSRTQPLQIKADNNLDIKNNPKRGTALNMPSVLDKKPSDNLRDSLVARNVKMLPERELKQAGFDLEIDPRIESFEKNDENEHYGDMYLGDLKTSSKFVGVVCRDHEYVDGDRVRIYVNGVIVEYNILLSSRFKGVNLTLEKGFNRLDFEALNQGSSGPNTAQVDVYDEKGELLYSKKWLLSTGSKASLIIVHDD